MKASGAEGQRDDGVAYSVRPNAVRRILPIRATAVGLRAGDRQLVNPGARPRPRPRGPGTVVVDAQHERAQTLVDWASDRAVAPAPWLNGLLCDGGDRTESFSRVEFAARAHAKPCAPTAGAAAIWSVPAHTRGRLAGWWPARRVRRSAGRLGPLGGARTTFENWSGRRLDSALRNRWLCPAGRVAVQAARAFLLSVRHGEAARPRRLVLVARHRQLAAPDCSGEVSSRQPSWATSPVRVAE